MLFCFILLDKDRYEDKTIKPATGLSFHPLYAVVNRQNGEKANIASIFIFEKISISLLKFKGNIEDKYIGITSIQTNTILGKELFIAANGAKTLWIGK